MNKEGVGLRGLEGAGGRKGKGKRESGIIVFSSKVYKNKVNMSQTLRKLLLADFSQFKQFSSSPLSSFSVITMIQESTVQHYTLRRNITQDQGQSVSLWSDSDKFLQALLISALGCLL